MIIGWLKEFCCAVGMILGAVIGVMAFVFIFQVAPVVTEEIQDLSVIRSVSEAIYEVRAYFYYRNLYARINDPELRRIKPIILEKGGHTQNHWQSQWFLFPLSAILTA